MKNRPTEPGHWWWEDTDGDHHVAEFDEDIEAMAVTYRRSTYHFYVGQFEDEFDVKRWLGKVVPPRSRHEE